MNMLYSMPTVLLFAVAIILSLWGSLAKRGGVLSLFGGIAGAAGLLAALVDGATLREGLICVLILLLLSLYGRKGGTAS